MHFEQDGYDFKVLKNELENLASTSSFEEPLWLFSLYNLDLNTDNINPEFLSKYLKMTPGLQWSQADLLVGCSYYWLP